MVDNLPSGLNATSRFLNIAGKTGEIEYALIQKYKDAVKKNIYTLPLNPHCKCVSSTPLNNL